MKKFKLLPVLFACIFFISGCFAGSTAPDAMPLPTEDNATEITVEVWDYTGFYVNAAQKFEEETGVKVNIINDYEPGKDEIFDNRERIQAELMAGKGSDIYAGIYLDFVEFGQNGHLCNLENWIAADPYFSDDAYYMNILKSGFDRGNVYSVPLFIWFSALGSTIEVPQLDGQSLNWEEFFELTKGIKRSGVLYGIDDYEFFKRRFYDRYNSFIDQENKTQTLDSSEMMGLLEQCKEWGEQDLCVPLHVINAATSTEIYRNAFFHEYTAGGIELLLNIRSDYPYLDDEPYLYDIPSDSGENDKSNKISGTDYICINAASQHKGTAWKFIKFLLSEEIQATGIDTPVNQKAATAQISKTLTDNIEYYRPDIDTDQMIKEAEAILAAIEEVPNSFYKTDIERIIFQEARRYFINEISAEEAMKIMAAGVELYFKEQ